MRIDRLLSQLPEIARIKREFYGMSVQEAANDMGVNRETYMRLETERVMPSYDTIRKAIKWIYKGGVVPSVDQPHYWDMAIKDMAKRFKWQ